MKSSLAILLTLTLVLAACGGSEPATETEPAEDQPTAPGRLAPADLSVIDDARQGVSTYCRKVGQAIAGSGPPPTEDDFAEASAAVDELAALAAERPDAEAADGVSPSLALGDLAENLEGTNCDSRLVARIDEALAELPAD